MNLIVFDLEWNIGYQPKTFLYHGTELTLRGGNHSDRRGPHQ